MGVLDRLTRRSDGARRFSFVAAAATTGPVPWAPAPPCEPGAADGPLTPAGVAVMPLALRAGAVAALGRDDRSAAAVTEPLTALSVGRPADAASPRPSSPSPAPSSSSTTSSSSAGPSAAPPVPGAGYAVLDAVVSGLSPEHDRLLEVAVVQLDADGAVVGEWTSLLRPSVLTSPDAADPALPAAVDLAVLAATAGVDASELAAAPTVAEVAGELVAALAGRVLVAHGVSTDLAFLRTELARAGVVLPLAPVLCTLESSWRHLPGLTRRRLADCCEGAGVALDGVPTALTDARAAAGLLQRFLARSSGRGERGERGEAQAALVTRAAAVAWPQVEVPPRSSASPRSGAQPSLTDVPGRLAVVLESLPLAGADLPLPAVAGHVELLAAALAAGPLDERAARALALLADAANLTRAQVRAASRGVVLALAGAVGRDAGAGQADRDDVMAAARALAVDADDVATAMAAAAVATGSLPAVDVRAGGRSIWASGGVDLVLPEIPAPRVPAAVPARHGQPAAAAVPVPAAAAAVLDLSDAEARAAVRTWARAQGLTVSDRGKLPKAVVEAYAAREPELAAAR